MLNLCINVKYVSYECVSEWVYMMSEWVYMMSDWVYMMSEWVYMMSEWVYMVSEWVFCYVTLQIIMCDNIHLLYTSFWK